MTLTEQWKKGELPDGMYYMENTRGIIGRIGHSKAFPCYNVKQILAPVPSYEEWQELQEYKRIVTSYNMKPIDYDIACETVNKLLDEKEKLRNELGLLKESIGKDCGTHYINLFLQENQQLKELLLVCRKMLEKYQYSEGDFRIGDNAEISTSLLLKMIDNAVGEKK